MGTKVDRAKRYGLIAFILAWLLVSAYTTVSLCMALHNAVASVCIGLLWTVSKVVMGEYCRRLWNHGATVMGFVIVASLSGILILGDICGTISYFMNEDGQQLRSRQSSERKNSVYDSQLNALSAEISATQKRADGYLDNGRISRSSAESKRLAALRREQSDILSRLSSVEYAPPSSAEALSVLGLEEKRTLVFLVIAIVIEACPAVGIAMMRKKNDSDDSGSGNIVEDYSSTEPRKNVVSISGYKSSGRDMQDIIRKADELVRGGLRPSYSSLRTNLQIGQDAVVEVVKALREQGTIKRVGRGHVAV